ncbi:hypothetical protein C8R44DRAFT_974385 [Mycena epipterygia]|nr:hypothetical protein C8R44DRAFT_974385 [Mycena epipterygia]
MPIDWEIPVISRIISENQTRVDALNAQIDMLRPTIEKLVAERGQRQECVRRHVSVVSVVRRVTQELICEILALTPCTRRIGSISINCPPWRLGRICRSWHNWALADPFLWRSIEIINCLSLSCEDAYPLPMIETQLLRCANVPLSVTFDTRDCENAVERPLWDLLILHCHRWGALRLHCNTNPSLPTLLTLLDALSSNNWMCSLALCPLCQSKSKFLFRCTGPARNPPHRPRIQVAFVLLRHPMGVKSPAIADDFLGFVNRFSYRLTTLSLESCLSTSALVCLRDLPSLEFLLVDAWKWNLAAISSFLNTMTLSNTPSDLCPSLTSFAYGHFHDPTAFSADVCLALVAMADGDTSVQKSLAEGTQVLVRQGLDVAFYGDETKAFLVKHRP